MSLRSLFPALLGALAFLLPAAASAKLSSAEQRMVQTVDAEQERTVSMLAGWVNQNSGSLNLPGVEAVGRMLRGELEPLGLKVEWLDMKAAGRAGHIVARHKGNGRGKRMLLIGHLDTVFEPDSPFQKWERRGNTGIGPGSGDDKGGMAVIVAALRAMKAAGTLKRADIVVVLTGDEEDAGSPIEITRGPLIEAGKWADVALDFENLAREDGRDMGSTARRSSDSWTLTVTGRTGHSSGVFAQGVGYGAIYEAARIIDAFRRELREEKLTYNVGLIGGGTTTELDPGKIRVSATGKTNIIPATVVVRGDLRAISQDQIARAQAKMQAVLAQPLPGTKAVLTFDEGGYPPMAPTPGNRALLERLNRVNRDMGLAEMGELDPEKRGAGDISFVAADVDGLAGLGPAGSGSHAPGESVDIPSIFTQAKRAAIMMSRMARERRR
jgi:glutamate carboxypeptidase